MASQDLTQLPKTRKDAIASGNAFYFTGVPCKSGHISKRYSLHRSCFECCSQRNKTPERKIYMSGYRKKNPEKIKTLNKNWFLKNKEHHHHYQNKYRSDNVEKVQQFARERCRKYHLEFGPYTCRTSAALCLNRIAAFYFPVQSCRGLSHPG